MYYINMDNPTESMSANLRFSKSSNNAIVANMLHFKKNERHIDFKITIGEKSVSCHQIVLASSCGYFNKLFESNPKQNVLELENLKFEAVEKTILYLYGEQIRINWDELKDYVEVSHKFQILEMKRDIENHIQKYLTSENCLGWFYYAEKYALKIIQEAAKTTILENMKDVGFSDEFKSLSKSEVVNLLREIADFSSGKDNSILTAVIEWVDFNPVSRKEDVFDVLSKLHLDQCSPGTLKAVTEKYEDLLTAPPVMKLVQRAALAKLTKLEDAEITFKLKVIQRREQDQLFIKQQQLAEYHIQKIEKISQLLSQKLIKVVPIQTELQTMIRQLKEHKQ